jgi:hypothetical protein
MQLFYVPVLEAEAASEGTGIYIKTSIYAHSFERREGEAEEINRDSILR